MKTFPLLWLVFAVVVMMITSLGLDIYRQVHPRKCTVTYNVVVPSRQEAV